MCDTVANVIENPMSNQKWKYIETFWKLVISGYGVSKVVSHSVAAPVYGGYHGGYGTYGGYGAYGVSKVVSPVTTLGMCVAV